MKRMLHKLLEPNVGQGMNVFVKANGAVLKSYVTRNCILGSMKKLQDCVYENNLHTPTNRGTSDFNINLK